MGGKVPRRLVSAGDALPHRAHEEDRPVTARASRTDPQLFPRSEAALQRGCRGPEQQSQTHNEKILRIPHLPLSRTRPLSLTWQITGAGINPRFFLTNLPSNVSQPVVKVIEAINPILRGWVNYFRVGNSSRCFAVIKDWAEKKVRKHLMRARNRQGHGWKRWSREWLYGPLGLFNDYQVRYSKPEPKVAPAR